jgi:hypothetical protein
MTLAVCGAFYNPRKATCGTTHRVYCYGYSDPQVAVSPFSVGVGNTTPLYAYLTYGDSSGRAFLLLRRSQDFNRLGYLTHERGGSRGRAAGSKSARRRGKMRAPRKAGILLKRRGVIVLDRACALFTDNKSL